MRILAPEWLILVPVLLFLAWYRPDLRLWRPLRAFCLLLLVLLLVRPEMRIAGSALDLWVLVDRSASAEDLIEPRRNEWQSLIEKEKDGKDRIFYVDFAHEPMLRSASDHDVFAADREETRLGLAMSYALSQMDSDRANRLLVLSDGYSTESLAGYADRLIDQQVPLDYRLVIPADAVDYRFRSLRMPSTVQLAEPFLVEAEVTGDADGDVPYEVYLGNNKVGEGTALVRGGEARIRFTDRMVRPGAHLYQLLLRPDQDAFPGNDAVRHWVEVTAGPRIVLISGFVDDPLAVILRGQGFDVEVVTELATLNAGILSGARAVIFNHVPAYRVPTRFLKAFDFYVRMQGGGFLMTGGPMSFGSGGYFESPIDPLLPVSMELKEEHRKLQVAMAIVMDRSGSMGAGVAGSGPGVTKMDLANEGAARAIELLGSQDAIAVFAVDSAAHAVVPLTTVGPVRSKLIDHVRRINSGGGGIYVYTGLDAAWEQLQQASVGQRHVILFTDAADSEEPGEYKKLIEEMVEQGTTISVIGLGTEQDPDAEFIKDVATRGNGRIFFNSNAADLPALFAQEAVSVARSAFIEEPVPLVPSAGWLELAARSPNWVEQVDGYNLSYLRPDAAAGALSGDEYGAPLVAFWQRGVGRVAAVSFPMAGEHSQSVRAWPEYGDFVQTLGRWLMGEKQPPGLGLRHELVGTTLFVDLLYDERWEDDVSKHGPQLHVLREGETESKEVTWERIEPGRYRASLHLAPGSMVRGAVRIGTTAMPFGPVTVGLSPEWAFSRDRLLELEQVSRLSGGEKRLDMSEIWRAPRRSAFRDIRDWLAMLFLVVFLVEALVARMGWSLPKIAWRPRRIPIPFPRPRRTRKPEVRELPPPVPGPKPSPVSPQARTVEEDEEASEERRRRFSRAKRNRE